MIPEHEFMFGTETKTLILYEHKQSKKIKKDTVGLKCTIEAYIVRNLPLTTQKSKIVKKRALRPQVATLRSI